MLEYLDVNYDSASPLTILSLRSSRFINIYAPFDLQDSSIYRLQEYSVTASATDSASAN